MVGEGAEEITAEGFQHKKRLGMEGKRWAEGNRSNQLEPALGDAIL